MKIKQKSTESFENHFGASSHKVGISLLQYGGAQIKVKVVHLNFVILCLLPLAVKYLNVFEDCSTIDLGTRSLCQFQW